MKPKTQLLEVKNVASKKHFFLRMLDRLIFSESVKLPYCRICKKLTIEDLMILQAEGMGSVQKSV